MKYTALIGNPVEHSLSNYMFAYFANLVGLEYGHLKIKIENKEDLKDAFNSLKKLHFSGFNITLPYKIDSISYLDFYNDSVLKTGAVNTVKIKDNKLIGFNTDTIGAIKSIENRLKMLDKSDKVLIFGAGGASRAVIYELFKKIDKENLFITNRSENRLSILANDFNISNLNIVRQDEESIVNTILNNKINFFINTTSLGMNPNNDSSIIEESLFEDLKSKGFDFKNTCFFDAVFNPFKTKFLLLGEKFGAKICSGLYWMVYQGVDAFNIWTDSKLTLTEEETDKIINYLKTKYENSHN